jgi:hypothetical protein
LLKEPPPIHPGKSEDGQIPKGIWSIPGTPEIKQINFFFAGNKHWFSLNSASGMAFLSIESWFLD